MNCFSSLDFLDDHGRCLRSGHWGNMSRRLNIHRERRKRWCPSPPPPLLESLNGQVKQLIHVSDMRRPFHVQDLQGKGARGRILMLLNSDWSQAKEAWLPVKSDCVILNACFVLWHFTPRILDVTLSATIPQPHEWLYMATFQIESWLTRNTTVSAPASSLHQGPVS